MSIWAVPAGVVIVVEAWRLQRPAIIAACLVTFLVVANASFYVVYAIESSQQFGLGRLGSDIAPGLVFWSFVAAVAGGGAGLVGGAIALSIVRRYKGQTGTGTDGRA